MAQVLEMPLCLDPLGMEGIPAQTSGSRTFFFMSAVMAAVLFDYLRVEGGARKAGGFLTHIIRGKVPS